jgi:hypothetical protein
MKSSLIAAAALLASSTLAAKYEAGTICHSNVECEQNCIGKQYTIVNEDGGYVFVCDPGVANPTGWYSLSCTSGEGYYFEEATAAACKEVGGQSCKYSCALSGKRSEDEDNRKKWSGSCGKDPTGHATYPKIYLLENEKSAKISC